MPLNRPSFASLPRDLRDDATCIIRCHYFTSFEAKLENPSPTCFVMKQGTECRRVSSQRLHPLIGFEAQTDKPPPPLVLSPKPRNRRGDFDAQITKLSTLILSLKPRNRHSGFEAKPLTNYHHRF
jgi:hypothetical protein